LAHKDSMGNVVGIPPGDVQRMSAGRGVMHSEFNHAPRDTTHFFQIWIEPHTVGIAPSYEQKTFSDVHKQGRLCLLASGDEATNAVRIHADARLYGGLFDGAQTAQLELAPRRKCYVHLVRGAIEVNGTPLNAGDAALLDALTTVQLAKGRQAEVLVFDLAP
ncbi:MAG: pirin family protein, partial [Rhodoferax sp.]